MDFLVTIEIDVDADSPADSPAEAARHAWSLLTAPDALLPVGTVTAHAKQRGDIGDIDTIDLQELAEASTPT